MEAQKELWLPESYKKAPPPKTGPAFGSWGGPTAINNFLELPGGGLLQFDLDRLTLQDYRSMRQHYQINISLAVLTFTLHQVDWWIECEDEKIADAIEENLRKTWTQMIRAISTSFWAGYSPIALQFDNNPISGKVEVTKFKDLIPEECDPNWKEVKGYAPPGNAKPTRYLFDGIKQQGTTWPIPVENSLWYPILMENGNYYGRKLLRPAYPAWFFSQLIHLFANRYFERFGEPLPVGRAPFDDEIDDGTGNLSSGKEVMESIVSNIRNRAAVVLPSDRTPGGSGDKDDFEWSIDYLESQMRGADFERYLTRLDEEMSLAMFMPVLLFRTADIGSYNLGQAHEKLFFMMMNGLVSDMKDYLDKYLISKLVDYNFSPKAPRAYFRFRQMAKDTDETLRAIVTGAMQQEFLAPDIDELGLAIGLKLHEVVQVTESEMGDEIGDVERPGQEDPDREQDEPGPEQGAVKSTTPLGQRVLNRLADQAKRANFDGNFKPTMGHERQFARELMAHGFEERDAMARAETMARRVNTWLTEAQHYDSPDEFVSAAEKVLNFAYDEAASGG